MFRLAALFSLLASPVFAGDIFADPDNAAFQWRNGSSASHNRGSAPLPGETQRDVPAPDTGLSFRITGSFIVGMVYNEATGVRAITGARDYLELRFEGNSSGGL